MSENTYRRRPIVIDILQNQRQYLYPFVGEHMLFFAAWRMLAACVARYALRDADSLTVPGWPQRNRARGRT